MPRPPARVSAYAHRYLHSELADLAIRLSELQDWLLRQDVRHAAEMAAAATDAWNIIDDLADLTDDAHE